jgi:uncharacterized protein YndB with AHSA1/START domain
VATVTGHVNASPAAVFGVLANGWYYSGWVVGASHVRAVEEAWPAVGSRLFHTSGLWPVALADETRVEQVTPNEHLVLTARGRPLGAARIELSLAPEDGGTRVTLRETPVSGPGQWVHNRVLDAALHRRNTESLARLAALSERRTAPASSSEGRAV